MFMHLLSKVLVVPRKKKFFHFTYPLNQSYLLHLTKMGTHSFRAPEKAAVNLEAQHNPLQIHAWIHLQACSPRSIVGSGSQ